MKLIICNTYSQLIIAIQLKLTLFKNCEVDIWMSDHSKNAEMIITPLIKTGIFNDVCFIEEREFAYERKIVSCICDVLKYSFTDLGKMEVAKYDEIIFYSLSFLLYSIAEYYQQIEHDVIWSKMEEGIFSYETDFESGRRLKIARFLRRLSEKYEITDNITNYYCFFPELKTTHREWNLCKIPSLYETRKYIIPLLQKIFSCDSTSYKQRFIFFASSSDVDGKPFGETDIVLKVANRIGKDNLLVKMHPRDTREVYKDRGIEVMNNSWVPWEVMQLVGDLENNILITVNSGAFVTVSALMGGRGKGAFLYPSIEKKSVYFQQREKTIHDMLTKLHKYHLCEGIREVTVEELF